MINQHVLFQSLHDEKNDAEYRLQKCNKEIIKLQSQLNVFEEEINALLIDIQNHYSRANLPLQHQL